METIRCYELETKKPDSECMTKVLDSGEITLKEDFSEEDVLAYAFKCESWLDWCEDVDESSIGAFSMHERLVVCSTPDILLELGLGNFPMV